MRKECHEAKEEWLNKKCDNIEACSISKCSKEIYEEINEISGKRKSCPQSGCIKAKDGRMLIDRTDVLNR